MILAPGGTVHTDNRTIVLKFSYVKEEGESESGVYTFFCEEVQTYLKFAPFLERPGTMCLIYVQKHRPGICGRNDYPTSDMYSHGSFLPLLNQVAVLRIDGILKSISFIAELDSAALPSFKHFLSQTPLVRSHPYSAAML